MDQNLDCNHLSETSRIDFSSEVLPEFKKFILDDNINLTLLNKELELLGAEDRIRLILKLFPHTVATSSFGTQAAVTLSLAVKSKADIPVLFIDTQYHFPETYNYVEELKFKLKLNLHTFQSQLSKEMQEEKFGQLWLQGDAGHRQYTLLNKIAPLNEGLEKLSASAWISGIRKTQSWTRAAANFVEIQDGRLKLYPILDWTDEDVSLYMKENKLYPHPLWYQGFKRIGDIHTTEYPVDWQGFKDIAFSQRECRMHTNFANLEENGSGI